MVKTKTGTSRRMQPWSLGFVELERVTLTECVFLNIHPFK